MEKWLRVHRQQIKFWSIQSCKFWYGAKNILVIFISALQTNALKILWNEALRKASCLSIS